MKNLLFLLFLLTFSIAIQAQVQKDLARSVPLWFEYDIESADYNLRWLSDEFAFEYRVNNIDFDPYVLTSLIEKLEGTADSFSLPVLESGVIHDYHIQKRSTNSSYNGYGLLTAAIELPVVDERGRCLIYISEYLFDTLEVNILSFMSDIRMDGWEVNYRIANDSMGVLDIKNEVVNWYDEDYQLSQSLILLGHIPVPYSGNSAYDGHSNHQGAWVADSYYADIDGNWTDSSVNNTTPSRDENKNIPGDGKFDQSNIPGNVEIEVGRIDFSNLPAFALDEIGLTEKYLEKNHAFRTGEFDLPERALVENNFASFDEGFGQSAWRNFTTFFGGEDILEGNYEAMVDSNAYLWSYGCGGGSYTSCGGIGNTTNLWAAKEVQTVFTMIFGSYFGDWDIKNNFLRSALGSGKILTNVWSGRPIYLFHHMALGKHIGHSIKFTQNANSSVLGLGYGAHSAQISLLGDPTLRMHPLKPVNNLQLSFDSGDGILQWDESEDAVIGYNIYRKINEGEWTLIGEFVETLEFIDPCLAAQSSYQYQVKAIKLQYSGSGSYYNSSQGVQAGLEVEENPELLYSYADFDQDGYGYLHSDTLYCGIPEGYVENAEDCDDNNPDINPDANDIPDNGIDEDCDGEDASGTSTKDLTNQLFFYPNPARTSIHFPGLTDKNLVIRISDSKGMRIMEERLQARVDLNMLSEGAYFLEILKEDKRVILREKLVITK